MRLLIATGNEGKKRECAAILGDLPVELVSLRDVGVTAGVEETGSSFEENAALKARHYSRITGLPALADDSGLEVQALGGEPGIYSARYGGLDSDEERIALLLDRMKAVPGPERTARFVCAVCLVWPGGPEWTSLGTCEGLITRYPVGTAGFGYDPVFLVRSEGRTFAQMSPHHKNSVSHRARALREMKVRVKKWLQGQIDRSGEL